MTRDLELAQAQLVQARVRLDAMLDDLHPSHPRVRDLRECIRGLTETRDRLERLEDEAEVLAVARLTAGAPEPAFSRGSLASPAPAVSCVCGDSDPGDCCEGDCG